MQALPVVAIHLSRKLKDNLQTLRKSLNCPVKLNKSALRTPGTRHSWTSLLAVIQCLVQLCKFDDHRLNSAQPPASENKELEQERKRLIDNVNVLEGM